METGSGKHTSRVWERFWREKKEIAQVYSNAERVVQQILATGNLSGKLIMEIGAGSGRDGFKLIDAGAKVIMLDYAQASLHVIKTLAQESGKHVWLVRGDAFHLPFKQDALDLVFHQGLLEHFADPRGIVTENYRVLKPGGFALADVPQRYHFYTVAKHLLIWLNKWFAGWETEFSRRQLENLFSRAGFEIHHVYGDWMRPSFAYRLLRELAKKAGIKLPLYPKCLPLLSRWRNALRRRFQRSSLAFYTFMDIGVIGMK
jgi:ubiquinone/menaquinone biosynthesis C-methylase UbiE